jgi:hypothetical protein
VIRVPQPYTNGQIVVVPLGDIQWAGQDSSTAMTPLKKAVNDAMEMGAWFIGMGDYGDFLSPSNRQRLYAAGLYDTAGKVIDEAAHNLNRELYQEVLAPTKGRFLGLLQGHHFHVYKTGKTTDMEMCEWLEAPFLGTCAVKRLVVERKATDYSAAITSFQIWAHHGAGGGETVGAMLNKLEKMANHWEDIDCFLVGHANKLGGAPIERMNMQWDTNTGPRLTHRKIALACTGSFSRGYKQGSKVGDIPQGDFVEQKMLRPTAIGSVIARFKWRIEKTATNGTTKSGNRRQAIHKDVTIEA